MENSESYLGSALSPDKLDGFSCLGVPAARELQRRRHWVQSSSQGDGLGD
jgi:hypothetical protein